MYDMVYVRNSLNRNRYFVIDHVEQLIDSKFSKASTVGLKRVREFEPSSSEISSLISNQKGLFNKLLTVTVSEKEDKRIWSAYDTVDERAVIGVTIGLPALIIGAAEIAPFVYSLGRSSLPILGRELGKAFTVNKGKTVIANATYNMIEQYTTIALTENKWGLNNLKKIDKFDVGVSAFFSNYGGVVMKSTFDWKSRNDYGFNDLNDFTENIVIGSLKYKASNSFMRGIGKPLSTLAPGVGDIFAQGGKITIKTTIGSAGAKLKKNNEPN